MWLRGHEAACSVVRLGEAPVSSAALKKKHLIEAALFGRLDQKLRTIVQGTLPKKTAWVRELEGIWEPKTPAKGVC